jgi:predicted ArsR family transcriptional regulator
MPASVKKRRSGPLGHPTRVRIVRYIHDHGEGSPSEMAHALDVRTETLSHHVKSLVNDGVLKLARTVSVRGAVAHYYAIADGQPAAPDVLVSQETAVTDLSRVVAELVSSAVAAAGSASHVRVTCLVERLDD